MIPPSSHPSRRPTVRATSVNAFTLTEMMVTVAIFSLVVLAMVLLQIFGLKMGCLTSSKLKSTAGSLKALDQIRNQILEATEAVLVGNVNASNNTFTAVANGRPAIGNAVLVSNGPANLVVFYLNPATGTFYESGGTNNLQPMSLAYSIVNSQPFQAEDCFGNTIQAGSSTPYTIKMTLQFSNLVYAIPTPTYDTYLLQSRATPRKRFDNN
jgi:prepilin-type N-terminal cleavage/methylation domain-containing protein